MHSMKYSSIEFEVNIPETQIACELESNVVDLPQRSVKEHIEYALDNSIGGFVGYDFSDTAERYNMILVTEIPAEKFKNTKIHVVKTLDEAIRVAKELNDGSIDDMKVALLPHGANTLPKYR